MSETTEQNYGRTERVAQKDTLQIGQTTADQIDFNIVQCKY